MSFTIQRFDERDVALSGDTPYAHAQEEGARYVLSLDPDRLLYPFRKECGVCQPKQIKPYPNWESMGLDGHILGHYLSALSGFWKTTQQPEYQQKADYVVNSLALCQQSHGDGYVGGIPDSDELFSKLRAGDVHAQSFELDGAWVPLYNLHKTFAGLIDCWTSFDASTHASKTAKAVVIGLADWWCTLSDQMDDEAFTNMLQCEYGGLNESFALLYALTGNNRYLKEAQRFSDDPLFEQLCRGNDPLTGMHANTQIPKVLGYERIAELTGDAMYNKAVSTFWDSVVDHRSVSIGAHSVAEHFHPTDDFSTMITSRQGVETCNSYNMSKLAERLFIRTGESRYLDFYERVLENHILSTVGCHEHGFVYFTPMRPRHYRVYSAAQQSFWCCVGSGLENHARYGRMIYTLHVRNTAHVSGKVRGLVDVGVSAANIETGDRETQTLETQTLETQTREAQTCGTVCQHERQKACEEALAINVFIPSSLYWRDRGIHVTQQYRAGEGAVNEGTITFTASSDKPEEVDLYIRHPKWVTDVQYECVEAGAVPAHTGPSNAVSPHTVLTNIEGASDGYDAIHLSWTGSVTIHILHHVRVRLEPLPDGSPWASILRGPTVMALPDGFDDLDGLRGDDSRAGHIASGPLKPFADLPVITALPEGNTGREDGTVDVVVSTVGGSNAGIAADDIATDTAAVSNTSVAADAAVHDDNAVDGTEHDASVANRGVGSAGSSKQSRLTLVPFASMEGGRYSIYLPWASDGNVAAVRSTLKRIDQLELSEDQKICDEVRCGEQQSEVDHRYRGLNDSQGYADGKHYRVAHVGGWFEYAIKDWERSGSLLEVTLLAEDADQSYGLTVAGSAVTSKSARMTTGGLVTDTYPVARGSLGVGDDMVSMVRVLAIGNADGPRIVSVRLSSD